MKPENIKVHSDSICPLEVSVVITVVQDQWGRSAAWGMESGMKAVTEKNSRCSRSEVDRRGGWALARNEGRGIIKEEQGSRDHQIFPQKETTLCLGQA